MFSQGIVVAMQKLMFYIIQHVKEEGAGVFLELLPKEYKIVLAGVDEFPDINVVSGVLIMGGPMGVYEKDRFPFIEKELRFIKSCSEKGVKILGVCLGAQMIAEAMGGKVYKGEHQEIGWSLINLTDEAKKDFVFQVFPKEMEVFQWHGDTFTLPDGGIRLATSKLYQNQAFKYGNNIYGLQYHIEVTKDIVKEWFANDYEKYVEKDFTFLNNLAIEAFKRFLLI